MTETVLTGLLVGANYALLALGYTLVFGIMHMLTLAHGQVFMASGLIALVIADTAGLPLLASGVIAVGIGVGLSVLTDYVSFRPVGYARPIAAAVSTIGFAIVIDNVILQAQGSEVSVVASFPIPAMDISVGSMLIAGEQLISLVIAIAVMVATHMFVRRSKWGSAMRAFAHDPEAVGLLGVPVRRLVMLTLAIAGALAGLASFLLILRVGGVAPESGLAIGLIGLAVMTIGGLGSLPGAMVAGLVLGVVQEVLSYRGFGGYQDAIPWLLLIVVLLLRPQGLFGASEQ